MDVKAALSTAYRMDEEHCVQQLLDRITLSDSAVVRIKETARKLILEIRKQQIKKGGLDAFLFEYDLSSKEGISLMCLAEALLRIPDKATINKLIKDKLTNASWQQHVGKSPSHLVNAATLALMISGKVNITPLVRPIILQAMRILGRKFVMGKTIEKASRRAAKLEKAGFRYSYDMLGEAACTKHDAEIYYQNYLHAIDVIGQASNGIGPIKGPGISIKLSALHPRYQATKRNIVLQELLPKLKQLALTAKKYNIGLTIDAEESDRLELSLDLIEAIILDPELDDWHGFGLAVQAYQKRAPFVIDLIVALAQQSKRKIMVRLVKGAYWDSEIKLAQEKGLQDYPVFTRKITTDVSYLACVKQLFAAKNWIYPQFATHNAYSLAAILEMAEDYTDFEFQCLHGMGEALYSKIPCRIYAPVGSYDKLLAYLVRRLLENGANTSFVNRIINPNIAVEELLVDPCAALKDCVNKRHPSIPLPINIYKDRPNAKGLDITNKIEIDPVLQQIKNFRGQLDLDNDNISYNNSEIIITDPSDNRRQVGSMLLTPKEQVPIIVQKAKLAQYEWSMQDAKFRAECLKKAAVLFEDNKIILMSLLITEAGKTVVDAIAEVREAIDYCWYYAEQCLEHFKIINLTGVTGESNQLKLAGRGVIACISPWNFPLAIFIGQITAALAAGNAVIAKPAMQTPLIAKKAIELLYMAGIPEDVLYLLYGNGKVVGQALIEADIDGVVFTGSTDTARLINQSLAKNNEAIIPLIAETGGLNAMIVDSSALLEQVINDVILSAFGSAGQRCSSLRVLFIQEDIAQPLITMLQGAMAELKVGDPLELSTDIGPIIDKNAVKMLVDYKKRMIETAKLIYEVPFDEQQLELKLKLKLKLEYGNFFAPCAFEINKLSELPGEIFGPILHIIKYKASDLSIIIDDINQSKYGLTLGIHSRINDTIEFIVNRVRVGNVYVNRNMIGAVVGVQPFGGEKLSGTGPKAGGPNYLKRLATERTVTINTVAAGGNATLLCLQD